MVSRTAKRKELEDVIMPEPTAQQEPPKRERRDRGNYIVNGLICGTKLMAIIDEYIASFKNNNARDLHCVWTLPMTHKQTTAVFIAVFFAMRCTKKLYCILFNRQSGDRVFCQLIRTPLNFELPPNAYWDDDYFKVLRDLNGHVIQPCQSVWASRSIGPETFAPTSTDNLFHFSSTDSSLVVGQQHVLPNDAMRFVANQYDILKKRGFPCDAVAFIKQTCKRGGLILDVINLVGQTTHYVRIMLTTNNQISFEPSILRCLKRCTDELELGTSLWDGMDSTELAAFTASEFANIVSQVELAKTTTTTTTTTTNSSTTTTQLVPLPTSTIRTLNLEQDNEHCQTWMRFVRSQLAPQTYAGMNFVTIKLINIPSAWNMFNAQILKMKEMDTPIQPRIMFHGVRGKNTALTVESICKYGFNPKFTTTCVYGAGGTYCSPQIACALGYTPNDENQKFLFVCMVVPGKVGYNGHDGQQMAPDQHSWAHELDNGHQIYCSETIVPFALLTFVR